MGVPTRRWGWGAIPVSGGRRGAPRVVRSLLPLGSRGPSAVPACTRHRDRPPRVEPGDPPTPRGDVTVDLGLTWLRFATAVLQPGKPRLRLAIALHGWLDVLVRTRGHSGMQRISPARLLATRPVSLLEFPRSTVEESRTGRGRESFSAKLPAIWHDSGPKTTPDPVDVAPAPWDQTKHTPWPIPARNPGTRGLTPIADCIQSAKQTLAEDDSP